MPPHSLLPDIKYLCSATGDSQVLNGFKLYIFPEVIKDGCGRTWFELRRVHALVDIRCALGRWWSIVQKPRFSTELTRHAQVDVNVDILKSEKAMMLTTKSEDLPPPGLRAERFVQKEYLISSRGFAFFCAEWGQTLHSDDNKNAMKAVFYLVASLSCGSTPPPAFEELIQRLRVPPQTREGCANWIGLKCRHCIQVLGWHEVAHSCSWALIAQILGYTTIHAQSCSFMARLMGAILDLWVERVDEGCMRIDNLNVTSDPTKVAHPKGGRRNQRWDSKLVQHFVETVVVEKKFPSAARAARALATLPERTARQQEETHVVHYAASSYKEFANECQISVVADDIRVSGEKCQFAVAFSHQTNKAAWLAPQACLIPSVTPCIYLEIDTHVIRRGATSNGQASKQQQGIAAGAEGNGGGHEGSNREG